MTAPAVGARAASYDPTTGAVPRPAGRIETIDVVRGVVMILMAIDHVRVYAGVPAGGPTFGVFFTRWITHFVAPGFVFLAGTSAFLHGRKLVNRGALAKFLLTRGALLVVLELTVIRLLWTFNLDFAHYNLAGVIWMLGWCMILMAGIVWLPTKVIGVAGLALVALHNVTDFFSGGWWQAWGDAGPHWTLKLLYFGGAMNLGGDGGPPLLILYVLVPWIGVMMAGYAFGQLIEGDAERRRSLVLRLGVGVTLFFLVLRGLNVYGDPPRPWETGNMPSLLTFLNTAKYPASLAFLTMTMGPLLVLLALA